MKKLNYLLFIATLGILSSCGKDDPIVYQGNPNNGGTNTEQTPSITISKEIKNATQFAKDVLNDIYLWKYEIAGKLNKLDPDTCQNPIATLDEVVYYKNNTEYDKWTMLTNDVKSLLSSFGGVETTYGYSLTGGRFVDSNGNSTGKYFLIVNYVYENSPAAKAGLKRGDIIIKLDGNDITNSNFYDAYNSSSVSVGMGKLTDSKIEETGISYNLTAVNMYENPILKDTIFDVNGKKVAYLSYASFDLKSAEVLHQICKNYKVQGVKELILDLRYNGGGYVFTEEVLASMLAPSAAVDAKEIYQTSVYNKDYMEYFKSKNIDLNTYFSYTHQIETDNGETLTINTSDANIGLDKLYVLISSGTASASEGVVVGLTPFMNITLIGSQSHGKYCTGSVFTPDDLYKTVPEGISNWGIYAMIATYADKDGNNACRPNGLTPDLKVEDDVFDGYQLGNPNETLLHQALVLAGWPESTKAATRNLNRAPIRDQRFLPSGDLYGKRIDNRMKDIIRKK